VNVLGMKRTAGQATGRYALHQRWSVRGLAVLAVAATAALGVVVPGGVARASGASGRGHVAKVGTHYAVFKHLCSVPKPGHAACMAIRKVPANKSNPHAQPYTVHSSFPVGPSGFGLTPDDFATAYGYDPDAVAGQTQTVAIVDAYNDPNILSDLNVFDTQYGLPAETADSFRVVGQTGSTTSLPTDDTSGWSGEEALDVETVRGVCHLCKIVLVEANSSTNADLQAAVHTAGTVLGATEISNSYGGPEGTGHVSAAAIKAIEKTYTFKGVVVTASTGDDGWFSWDKVNDGIKSGESPNIPSSLPQVVSVGGTALNLNADATRNSETVWNENGKANVEGVTNEASQGASGGGCSNYFAADGWQSNVAGYAKTGCGKFRLAADVSADADPNTGYDVYTSYNCGTDCGPVPLWEPIGGTSLSSPLIAAMWALAGGAGGVAYPAMSLYGHFTSAQAPFYDVTQGGNSWCDADANCSADTSAEVTNVQNPNSLFFGGTTPVGTLDCGFKSNTDKPTKVANNHQCNAAPGYDGPSGVGTPKGLTAFQPLSPKATIKYGNAVAKSKITFSVGGSDPFPGGKFVAFQWDIAGKKTAAASPSTVFKKPGSYPVAVSATDNYGRTALATTTVKVVKR
jgi:subtilase family serine protease